MVPVMVPGRASAARQSRRETHETRPARLWVETGISGFGMRRLEWAGRQRRSEWPLNGPASEWIIPDPQQRPNTPLAPPLLFYT